MVGSEMRPVMPDCLTSDRCKPSLRCAPCVRGPAVLPRRASMSAKNATYSGMSSLIPGVPDKVLALFGDPPLLRGEDDSLYYTLMEQFADLVEPKDMIEWWWVKDMTDHTLEIRRLRRFKVLFVELQRDQTHENQKMLATVGLDEDEEPEPVPLPDSEKDSAKFFMYLIDRYKGVDRLIASAELRRD